VMLTLVMVGTLSFSGKTTTPASDVSFGGGVHVPLIKTTTSTSSTVMRLE
jgi:hypothetical protein